MALNLAEEMSLFEDWNLNTLTLPAEFLSERGAALRALEADLSMWSAVRARRQGSEERAEGKETEERKLTNLKPWGPELNAVKCI